MTKEGLLVVISGPSATGKGTVCKALLDKESQIYYSISATTRFPRPGEEDGINYFFLDRGKFEEMIAADEFLEWAEVYGNYYGTPKSKVCEELSKGRNVILEIDIQGALKVKNKSPYGVFIFIMPPSLEELEARIRKRGTETEEVIQKRLGCARAEIAALSQYHYVVINDEVEKAVEKIMAIIIAEKSRVDRNPDLITKQIEKIKEDCN